MINASKKTLVFRLLPLFIGLALGFNPLSGITQEPNISYPVPVNKYVVGGTITPLVPQNIGGTVPPTKYGDVTTYAGNGRPEWREGAVATAGFWGPAGLTVDASGNLYVADTFNNRIRRIDRTDGQVTTVAGTGANTILFAPYGLAFDGTGKLYVSDTQNHQLKRVNADGSLTLIAGIYRLGDFADGQPPFIKFNEPEGLVFDATGNLYMADAKNNTIRKITMSPGVEASSLAGSGGVAGYVNNTGVNARFSQAVSIVIGNDGNFFVTDCFNNTVRMITPAGVVTTYAGTTAKGNANGDRLSAVFNFPTGLAIDPVGNLYVSDNNHLIRRISKKTGIVSTIAGNGQKGDLDGLRWDAMFDNPIGMVFDRSGNLFIADEHNNKIKRITLGGGYSIDKKLPAGLDFDPVTGTISGVPSATSPETQYTVTGYNDYGESSFVLTLSVSEPNLRFPELPLKSICDADFDPGATSPTSVNYESSDPSKATIVNGKIHIVGTGIVEIRATDGVSDLFRTLTINGLTPPAVTIKSLNTTACNGMPLSFKAETNNAGSNPSYQWLLNGQNTGVTTAEFSSESLNNGDKLSCVVTNSDNCVPVFSSSSEKTLIIMPYTPLSVEISSSAEEAVCPGTTITFTADAIDLSLGPMAYQWQVNGVAPGITTSSFTSNELQDGDVVNCLVTSSGACIVNPTVLSNSLTVEILSRSLCETIPPNAFSPNGDGINDTWIVTTLLSFPKCTVSIYNRYGQQVFQSIGYKQPWDGTKKGKQLPAGTYYYVIATSPDFKRISGPVTIIR